MIRDREDRVNYAVPLPMWLDEYEPDGSQTVQMFHSFVKEWHAVLNSFSSELDQCAMDSKWNEIMLSQNLWISKRAKHHTLSLTDETKQVSDQLVIKDLRISDTDSNTLIAVIFGLPATENGMIPEWHHLKIDLEDTTPFVVTRSIEPCGIPHTSGSQAFSQTSFWGRPCSIPSLKNLSVDDLPFDGETPVELGQMIPRKHISFSENGTWHIRSKFTAGLDVNKPKGLRLIAYHCISSDPIAADDLAKSGSGCGSMTSSSDQGSSDGDYSASEYSSDSEQEQHIDHCMVFLHNKGPPIYVNWKGQSEHSEVICTFHPTEPVVLWSHTAQELCITNLASGRTQCTTLPEPADVKLSPTAAVRKELFFSDKAQELSYLLYTASNSEISVQQTISISSFRFSVSEEGYLLQRTHPSHSFPYESTGQIQNPLLLTCWTSDYLYAALPPLSCNAKIVRLRIPHGSYSDKSATRSFETLRDPVFFPYSTPYRDPKLKVLSQGADRDILALMLDAETSYEQQEGGLPVVRQAPSLLTWSIAHDNDWRAWDPIVDSQSNVLKAGRDQCKMLRGNFVAADKRYNVPVRSGLNWRKKAFLSCS